MKKKILIVLIFIFLLLLTFLGYKVFLLNKYKANERTLDANSIFIETVTISNDKKVDGDVITFEELSVKNYFNEFEEHKTNSNLKAKYDMDGNVVSAYSISKDKQYINSIDLKSDEIKTDIELFKYIKDNYYFKNTIFTSKKIIENNYLINSFVENGMPEFENITLINGKINGYILDMGNSRKEIHLLHNDEQYIISLIGEELINNEFVMDLLETVEFS